MAVSDGDTTWLVYTTVQYCTVLLCTVPRESGEQCPYIVQVLLVLTWRKLGPGWAGPGWQQQAGQYGSVHTRTGDTSPVQQPASVETRQSYQQLLQTVQP